MELQFTHFPASLPLYTTLFLHGLSLSLFSVYLSASQRSQIPELLQQRKLLWPLPPLSRTLAGIRNLSSVSPWGCSSNPLSEPYQSHFKVTPRNCGEIALLTRTPQERFSSVTVYKSHKKIYHPGLTWFSFKNSIAWCDHWNYLTDLTLNNFWLYQKIQVCFQRTKTSSYWEYSKDCC